MKIVIILACLAGTVIAETCTGDDTTECAHEICADTFVPTCENNICTCNKIPDPNACTTLDDCHGYWYSHHCGTPHKHCMNDHCICTQHGHHG